MIIQKHLELIGGLYNIVCILYIINAFLVLIKSFTDRTHVTKEKQDQKKVDTPVDVIGLIIHAGSILLFYGFLIYIVHSNFGQYSKTVTVVLGLLFVCQNAAFIIPSTKRIGTIIIGNTKSGDMEIKDFASILVFTTISILLYGFKFIERIIVFATTCKSIVAGDFISALIIFLTISINVMLICTLLVLPAKILIKIINSFSKETIILIFHQIDQKTRDLFFDTQSTKTLTVLLRRTISSQSKKIKKVLLCFMIIPVLLIDIIYIFLSQIVFILGSMLFYTVLIVKQLVDAIYKISTRLLSISGKTVVAISFRIAIIVGLSYVVITNRYIPIFRNDEASTAVAEFVSSTIIIPLILEWLLSFKPQWRMKKNTDDNT